MTITLDPTADRIPDWDSLKAISDEVDRLRTDGRWNCEAFERLLPKAREAAGDEPDALEPLLVAARPEWYADRLQVKPGDRLYKL